MRASGCVRDALNGWRSSCGEYGRLRNGDGSAPPDRGELRFDLRPQIPKAKRPGLQPLLELISSWSGSPPGQES